MAKATQVFNHSSPSVPTLTKGMMLGASGVSAPTLRIVGTIAAAGASNGQFNDQLGRGQFDYDSEGNLWICNLSNNAFEKWTRNVITGDYAFSARYTTLNALGSALACDLIAVDRTRTPNQLHVASSVQTAVATAIGVWDISASGPYTVANRVRSYGTFSGSNGTGNARAPLGLTLSGDFAYLVSSAGDMRLLKINHTTNTLITEATRATLGNARFAGTESAMFTGGQLGTDLGLRKTNVSTLAPSARVDSDFVSGYRYTRRGVLNYGTGGDLCDIAVYDGRVYVRMREGGIIQAWNTADNSFSDEFLSPGGNGPNGENYGAAPGQMFTNAIQYAKIGFCAHPTLSDDFLAWSGNAQTSTQPQNFLNAYPVSIATATWVYSGWSAGINTLQSLLPDGTNLAAEKHKARLRKNGGTWYTLVAGQFSGAAFAAAISGLGTFTGDDELEVEGSLSTWARLDGHATKVACVDKLPPTNVNYLLGYDDSAGDVYVPYPSSGFQGRAGGTVAARGRVSF